MEKLALLPSAEPLESLAGPPPRPGAAPLRPVPTPPPSCGLWRPCTCFLVKACAPTWAFASAPFLLRKTFHSVASLLFLQPLPPHCVLEANFCLPLGLLRTLLGISLLPCQGALLHFFLLLFKDDMCPSSRALFNDDLCTSRCALDFMSWFCLFCMACCF